MGVSSLVSKWTQSGPYVRSAVRIVAALAFMSFGSMKLFGWPPGMPPGTEIPFLSQMWIGGFLEVFGGFLLVIGLFTRPVAFILSGEMAIAYFQFHFPSNFWPTVNMGMPAILYCFLWLYLSAVGPGPWSIDAVRGKR